MTAVLVFGLAVTLTATQAPTLADTIAWLETEAPALLGGVYRSRTGNTTIAVRLQLKDCILSSTEVFTGAFPNERTVTIPLKDVDPAGIVVKRPMAILVAYTVAVPTRRTAGRTITRTERGRPPEMDGIAAIFARDAAGAQRVSDAVRRAVELCDAPGVF